MTEHERARELLAIAIDFELAPGERDELDAHLDACADCRAFASSLAGDATALANLPQLDAPERVRESVRVGRPVGRGFVARPLLSAVIVMVLVVVPLGAGAIFFGGLGFGSAGSTTAPTFAPTPSPSPPSTPVP